MAIEETPNGDGQTGVLAGTSPDDDADETLESALDEGEGIDEEDDEPLAAPDGFALGGYDLDEDDDEEGDDIGDSWADAGIPIAISGAVAEREDELDRAIAALAASHVTHDQRKVRRKVSASTVSAGAGGSIPLVLELAGALHLSPELAAALSTGVGLLAAFIGGYLTPERQPALPHDVAYELMRRPRDRARRVAPARRSAARRHHHRG